MIVRKKIWPEFFEKISSGEKRFELRLADFGLKAGDMLVLEEYDPGAKKYTGRKIEKRCKAVTKINPMMFHSAKDVERHGLYVIEL
jgi:hypothetical protein